MRGKETWLSDKPRHTPLANCVFLGAGRSLVRINGLIESVARLTLHALKGVSSNPYKHHFSPLPHAPYKSLHYLLDDGAQTYRLGAMPNIAIRDNVTHVVDVWKQATLGCRSRGCYSAAVSFRCRAVCLSYFGFKGHSWCGVSLAGIS